MIGWLACVSVGPIDPPVGWGEVLVGPDVDGAQWLDARPADVYAQGHVPGAANVTVTDFPPLDASGGWPDAQVATLPATLAAGGLRADVPIVVYGDPYAHPAMDGALYWVLRYLGREDVAVLDGGIAAWVAAGGALETTAAAPGDFTGAPDPALLATVDELDVVVDVGMAGYPGAIEVPWDAALEDGSYRSYEEVAAAFAEVPDGAVTLSTDGLGAAHAFLTLELLGRRDVQVYLAGY